jgi:plasmid stability protein
VVYALAYALGYAAALGVDKATETPYCAFMKNITVSVDDAVYHRARIRAALMNTSVSALVRDALTEIAGTELEFERLRAEEQAMRQRLAARGVVFSAADRTTRDEAHERHAIR